MDGPRDYHTSEVSQKEQDKYYMKSLMWNLKYDANEPIYETETDLWTRKRDLWYQGGGVWGRNRVGG